MKKNLSNILFILMTFLGVSNTYASKNKEYTCFTPRYSRAFVVKKNTIAFFDPYSQIKSRGIASAIPVRTRYAKKGFTKILFISGTKHTIHINNVNAPNELDDYLIMRGKKGHEVTYPINCQMI